MPHQQPLAARLLLDALGEFARVADALPAPGRGGAIGRLNSGTATVLHVTQRLSYLTSFATGSPVDPWVLEHLAPDAAAPPFEDARTALDRARAALTPALTSATTEELARIPIPEPLPGFPPDLAGATLEYMVAHTAAHIFVHAGELSALASLVGAPDLGLPGAMAAIRGESE
jgi:hypothetical protein